MIQSRPFRVRNKTVSHWYEVLLSGKWLTFVRSGSHCKDHPREWLWRAEDNFHVHWFCKANGGHMACSHTDARRCGTR